MKKIFLLFVLLLVSGCTSAVVSQNQETFIKKIEISKKVVPAIITTSTIDNSVIKMLFVGDIMLDRNVKKQIDKNGEDYLLGLLAKLYFFNGYDVVAGNLEGPFANYRRQTSKEIAFRFEPNLISMLTKYNFNLFSIANNHSLDMGWQGLTESKANLKNANIDYYGDGYGITASSTIIKEIKGVRIGFVGFNDTYFPLDKNKIKFQIEEAKKQADLVIVNIHWGEEYKFLMSNKRQQDLAHLMIDNGADVIIGHHPHVIQEIETYKEKPIFYSLGNFIFDQYFSTTTQQGLAVALEIKDKKINYNSFPLQGSRSQVSLMEEEEKNNLLSKIYVNR